LVTAGHLEAVAVRHHHVKQDEVRPGTCGRAHRLGAGGRGHHLEASETQRARQEIPDRGLVVYHQDTGMPGRGSGRESHPLTMAAQHCASLTARCMSALVTVGPR
jgi:hypothetical protein